MEYSLEEEAAFNLLDRAEEQEAGRVARLRAAFMTAPQPAPTGLGADVTQSVIAELIHRDRVASQFGIAADESLTRTLIEELEARSAAGVKKYGTVLRTDNGRDALLDALQEAFDLVCYLQQVCLEQPDHAGLRLQFENAVNLLRELRKLYQRG